LNLKTQFSNFLEQNFKGLEIKKPLFYNWDLALRFDLQKKFTNLVYIDNDDYFDEVYNRAKKLFKFCFDKEDDIYLVAFSYKWRKQRIKKSNYLFKLIKSDSETEKIFNRISNRYESNEKWNRLIVKGKIENIDTKNLILGLCNTDFSTMKPCIREEVHLININKKLIFHIYDDRGLDILTTDKKILNELYDQFNKWILEYDRKEIEKQLNKCVG
jgi:hypothetical protein